MGEASETSKKRRRMQKPQIGNQATATSIQEPKKKRTRGDLAPGYAGIILAACIAGVILTSHSNSKQFGTQSDPLGPWFLPWLGCLGIFFGSILLLFLRNSSKGIDHMIEEFGSLKEPAIWIALGSLVVYLWAMSYLGFYLDTALLLGEFTFLFKLKLRTVILVGLAMELLAYLLFIRLLRVLIPGWPI